MFVVRVVRRVPIAQQIPFTQWPELQARRSYHRNVENVLNASSSVPLHAFATIKV